MRKRMQKWQTRMLSCLLCVCMIMCNLPVTVLSEELVSNGLCEHHVAHTAECGYVEAVAGSDCMHQHDASCIQIVDTGCIHVHGEEGCTYVPAREAIYCGHTCSVESCGYMAAAAEVLCACVQGEDGLIVHTEGCGYAAPMEEIPCGFIHENCGCAPAVAESGSCGHVCSVESGCQSSNINCTHMEHTEDCGYAAAVEGHECIWILNGCADCKSAGDIITDDEMLDEESPDNLFICTCETDDDLLHATNCPKYVAPENPECYCVEKCTEDILNVWCDVCGVQGSAVCKGADEEAVVFDWARVKWGNSLSDLSNSGILPHAHDAVCLGEASYVQLQEDVWHNDNRYMYFDSKEAAINVTLDLAGHKMYLPWTPVDARGNDVDITVTDTKVGGTFESDAHYSFHIVDGAKISFQAGNYIAGNILMYIGDNSEVSISGGTYTTAGLNNDERFRHCIVNYDGKLKITGGTFSAHSGMVIKSMGDVVIEGGTFNGPILMEKDEMVIKGGSFHGLIELRGGSLSLAENENPSGISIRNGLEEDVSVNSVLTLPKGYGVCDDDGKLVEVLEGEKNYWITGLGEEIFISFDANGGSGSMEKVSVFFEEVKGGYKLPQCGFLAPKGHRFSGWITNGKLYYAGGIAYPTEDMTVIAYWIPNLYPIYFEPGDETSVEGVGSPDYQYYGKQYVLPNNEVFDHEWKVFSGWLVNGELMQPGDTIKIEEEVTLYAVWRTPIVSFSANGGSGTMDSVMLVSKDYTLPENCFTASDGFVFDGWEVDGEEKQPGEAAEITKDVTVSAIWKKEISEVSFNANGGSGSMESVNVTAKEYMLPENSFIEPEGLFFYGWEVEGEVKQPGDAIKLRKDIIISAIWKARVSFDANGGTGEMSPEIVSAGEKYTLPDNGFTAPGEFGFYGWEVNGEEKQPGEVIEITKNITVSAIWSAMVSFSANGGTGEMSPEIVSAGEKYTLPDNGFTAPGEFGFYGWEVNGEEKQPGEVIEITKNITVSAIWSAMVSFSANGGIGDMSPEIVIVGEKYTLPDNGFTVPEELCFYGWEVNGEEKQPGEVIEITKNTTVSAIWSAMVSFSANGGTGDMSPKIVIAGEKYTLPDNGFTVPEELCFYGWEVNGEEKQPGEVIEITKNTTVSAIWSTMVSFSANDETGTMDPVFVIVGEYVLPDNQFTAPAEKMFSHWIVNGERKLPGEIIFVSSPLVIQVAWKNIEAVWGNDVRKLTNTGTWDDAMKAVEERGTQYVYIRLVKDITVAGAVDFYAKNITLDLNGKRLESTEEQGRIFNILDGSSVEITDTKGKGRLEAFNPIYMQNANAVNIHGGTIFGNSTAIITRSSGVLNIDGGYIVGSVNGINVFSSEVNIIDGTIRGGNKALYVNSLGGKSVTISGGNITNTSAKRTVLQGSSPNLILNVGAGQKGIYFPYGVSSYNNVPLKSLLAEGTAYWKNGKMLTLDDTVISLEGSIWVKASCANHIDSSDQPCPNCGEEFLHSHNWRYTLSGSTIHAACSDLDGFCESANGGSVTISAPENLIYDGTSKDAKLTYTDWILGNSVSPRFTYSGETDRTNVTGMPIIASVTLAKGSEKVTASVEYTVQPIVATISITNDISKTYDALPVSEPEYNVSYNSVYPGNISMIVEYKVKGAEDSTYTAEAPKIAGVYTVRVQMNGTGPEVVAEPAVKDFEIFVREVTISDVSVENKTYDGTSIAAISDYGIVNNVVDGDSITVDHANAIAVFEDADVGADKEVTFSGFVLKGEMADNYILVSQPSSVLAAITKKPVTVYAEAPDRIYGDSYNIDPSKVTITIDGLLVGDDVKYVVDSAWYHAHHVTDSAPVCIVYTLTGKDADNYQFPVLGEHVEPEYYVETTASITPRELTVSVTVNDKQYDGTNLASISSAVLNNVVEGDEVGLVNGTATFESEQVAEDIDIRFTEFTLAGDAEVLKNYKLIQPTEVTASIKNDWIPTEYMVISANDNGWLSSDFVLTPAEGYVISVTNTVDGVWEDCYTASSETAGCSLTFYLKNTATGAISLAAEETYKIDKTAPVGKVYFDGRDGWEEFLSTITFGLFFKDEVTVKVNAEDSLSGIDTIEYIESTEALTLEEVKSLSDWKAMPADGVAVTVEDTKRFVYFVRITDKAGNVSYRSTNGAEYDTSVPVIGGVENGKTYYTTQKFTVTEKNPEQVTVNNEVVTDFTLQGNTNAIYTITVTDKAGNSTTITVTMKPLSEITADIDSLEEETVTADDTAKMEAVKEALATVDTTNATSEEKAVIKEAQDKIDTLQNVIDVTADEVKTLEDKLADYDKNTVKSTDETAVDQLIADLTAKLEDTNLTAEQKEVLTDVLTDAKELAEQIDDNKAAFEDANNSVPAIDADKVTADDADALAAAKDKLEDIVNNNNYTDEEQQAAKEQLDKIEELEKAIEDTESEVKEMESEANELDAETVTSADKEAVEQFVGEMEEKLNDANLTEVQKDRIEAAIGTAEGILDKIAADQKVLEDGLAAEKDTTVDNYVVADKADLEDAAEELEKIAVEENANYTAEEKQKAQEEIDRIKEILTRIKAVEDVVDDIEDAVNKVDSVEDEASIPDTEAVVDAVLQALENYQKLDERQKELVSEGMKQLMDQALEKITSYEMIKGTNGKYTKETLKELEFKANGLFKLFKAVRVDKNVLADEVYTAKAGSTVVILKGEYLETLTVGEHMLEVVYEVLGKEYIADCKFKVEKMQAAPEPTVTPEPTIIPEPTATPMQTVTPTPTEMNEVDKVPATGDNTNIWGLLCMLFVSGAVLLFLEKKKEQSCKNKNK